MPGTRFQPLQSRDFRWFLGSLLTVTLSNEIQGTALSWQVFQMTKSVAASGFISLAEALPSLAVALYAGHLSDRLDRRRMALLASCLLLAVGGLLLGASLGLHQHALLVALFSLAATAGLGRSFVGPARTALGAELVPRELYAQAVQLRSATWQLSVIVGPGLGGLMITLAHGGVWLAYLLDVALMLAGMACLWAIRHRPPAPAPTREPVLASLRAGIVFVLSERILLAAMTLDLFAVLFGGAMSMMPAFADQVLHIGPAAFGWLRSSMSIGAVAMWVILGLLPPLPRAGAVMLWAVAGFGLCWMGVAFSPWFLLTMALLTAAGALDYISVVVRSTLVQSLTPSHMLGRVSAVNSIFIGSSNEIGGFESGMAAHVFGLRRSVWMGSAITLVVVALTARLCPALRRLGRLDELRPRAAATPAVVPAASPAPS